MTAAPNVLGMAVAGYWCEWLLSDADAPDEPRRIKSCGVSSPANALRWARVKLNMIGSALDEPASAYVFDWLDRDPSDAEAALGRGEPFEFAVSYGDVRLAWTARRVSFLPLVGGSPIPHGARGGAPWE
ncbi:hypothetical protein ACFXAZ_20460 [Streptomyces sp. NPDC059477]|uniref:hypothetical protein n=1 Tax=Streptomyces sp. NPDC059477 TaxID=3346847 RepID=UPI0036AF24CD